MFTKNKQKQQKLELQIAHGIGRYFMEAICALHNDLGEGLRHTEIFLKNLQINHIEVTGSIFKSTRVTICLPYAKKICDYDLCNLEKSLSKITNKKITICQNHTHHLLAGCIFNPIYLVDVALAEEKYDTQKKND